MGIVKWQASVDTSSSVASILSQLNALRYSALTMEPLYHYEENMYWMYSSILSQLNALRYSALTMEPLYHYEENMYWMYSSILSQLNALRYSALTMEPLYHYEENMYWMYSCDASQYGHTGTIMSQSHGTIVSRSQRYLSVLKCEQ